MPVITITHGKNSTHVDAGVIGNWRAYHRYIVGYSEPNYPVPAIPLEVDWWPDPMVTISETMPVSDYHLKEERYWRECERYF